MAESLEEQRHNLTHAVGECIMTWAAVERCLTLLFCECMGSQPDSPNFDLHAAVFDAVISVDARRDMVTAAIKYKLPNSDYLSEWRALWKEFRSGYGERNELAHADIALARKADGQHLKIRPFPTITHTNSSIDRSLEDLRNRNALFVQLSNEMWAFIQRIHAALEQLPKLP